MTTTRQTVDAARRKVLAAAVAACKSYLRGEITKEALDDAIEKLKTAKPRHKR